MSALKYWVWLSQLDPAGRQSAFLLEHFGAPELAYAAEEARYAALPISPEVRARLLDKSLLEAEEILQKCQALRLRILTYADTEYPERLRQIEQPPCLLYVKGQLPQIDDELAIAMVGARNASPYGEMSARKLGMDLARQGALIVSGIAQGIDSASLKGALSGGGRVVSVLGNGIDVVYPRSSESLYGDIPVMGALLSEYPPGTTPDGHHFPRRNRIISGLALGTVVVEGEERSGSLITARLALEQNRDVFAIPGAWDARMSRGPNRLIQRGEAKLILDSWDILEEYRHSYPHKIQERAPVQVRDLPRAPKPAQAVPKGEETPPPAETVLDLRQGTQGLTDDELKLLHALQGGLRCTADELIEKSEIPARRVLSALTMLQVRALVLESAGKRFHTPVLLLGYREGG